MLLFILVQHDGIHFILIYHDNFEFILIFEWQHSWESEQALSQISWAGKLGQVASEVMACLTVKMMQIAEIYPYFPHATWWKKQCIHYYSVNYKISPFGPR